MFSVAVVTPKTTRVADFGGRLSQSLSPRVQLQPLEKAWMRSSALGDAQAQRRLLCQESSLALKKVTAGSQRGAGAVTPPEVPSGSAGTFPERFLVFVDERVFLSFSAASGFHHCEFNMRLF